MRKDVEKLIQLCPTCQKQHVRKVEYNTIPFSTTAYTPNARLYVDTLELAEEDAHGNKAVIVAIDACTRWVEIYPIVRLTKEDATMRLLEHFGRYNPPTELVTDRGSQLMNDLVKTLCESQSVQYSPTTMNTPMNRMHW